MHRFRKAGYQAIDRICDYYSSLQEKNVISTVQPGYLREHIPCELLSVLAARSDTEVNLTVTPPEEGENFEVIADDYQKFIVPGTAE